MLRVLAALTLLAAGCTGAPVAPTAACEGTFEATMVRVVDGDTVEVAPCGTLRLALVDTPERGSPGFAEATDFTRSLCPAGGPAIVDEDARQHRDRYDRLLAVLFCGGKNVNAELLASGHAVAYVAYCDDSEFADDAWAAPHCAP